MMTNRSLLFGILGLLIGVGMTWMILDPAETTADDNAANDAIKLSIAVEQLEPRLERFSELLLELETSGAQLADGSPQRTPLKPFDPDPLVQRQLAVEQNLERLTKMVEQMLVQQGVATPLPDLTNIEKPMDLMALEQQFQEEETRRDLNHLGWSYQKVLDSYGKPSRSNPSPGGKGHKFYYELGDGRELIFWFIDDKVSMVFDP